MQLHWIDLECSLATALGLHRIAKRSELVWITITTININLDGLERQNNNKTYSNCTLNCNDHYGVEKSKDEEIAKPFDI